MMAMVSGTTCSLRLIPGGILDFGTMHARFRSSYQRRESFNIRIDAQSGELIEQAAKLVGMKRTDFIPFSL